MASKDWKISCVVESNWLRVMNMIDGNQIDLDLRVVRFEGKYLIKYP